MFTLLKTSATNLKKKERVVQVAGRCVRNLTRSSLYKKKKINKHLQSLRPFKQG